MTVYFCVLVAVVAIAWWSERRLVAAGLGEQLPRRVGLAAILTCAVLGGVSALRWNVGTDYLTYEWLFPGYVEEVRQGIDIFNEPGLKVIAWLVDRLGGDSAGMFAIAALLTMSLIVGTTWRWSPALPFAVGMIVLTGIWHNSFNGVRQFVACAIILAGHRLVIERRLLRWIIVCFLASLFHSTAIACLLFYLIPRRTVSGKLHLAILAGGVLALVNTGAILNFSNTYLSEGEWVGAYAEQDVHPLRVALAAVPLALYWLGTAKAYVRTNSGTYYINMLAVYAALMIASSDSALIARLALYPSVFLPLGLAYATSVRVPREKMLLRFAMAVVFGIVLVIDIKVAQNLENFRWILGRA